MPFHQVHGKERGAGQRAPGKGNSHNGQLTGRCISPTGWKKIGKRSNNTTTVAIYTARHWLWSCWLWHGAMPCGPTGPYQCNAVSSSSPSTVEGIVCAGSAPTLVIQQQSCCSTALGWPEPSVPQKGVPHPWPQR